MKQEEDYVFVTLDDQQEQTNWSDAIVIDVDGISELDGAVVIDEDFGNADFITLSDDTIMLSDADMLDISSADMDIDGTTISFGL